MGIQMEEEKKVMKGIKVNFDFDLSEEDIQKLFELVEKMKKYAAEVFNLEEEIDVKETELEKLENDREKYEKKKELEKLIEKHESMKKQLDELEYELLQTLGIDREVYILYNDNYNALHPSIVMPIDLENIFWIEIAPGITIYISKSK